ncbi:MAG: L,D-transpeptidase [Chitinophagaceae bacterium]|nr:L,D-transpeptidase [Chitinophagaceae bacterium]
MTRLFLIPFLFVLLVAGCAPSTKEAAKGFSYERFKDSVIRSGNADTVPAINIFDAPVYTPGKDSLRPLLVQIDTQWKREAALLERYDSLKKQLKPVPGFTTEEKAIIRENIRAVDSFLHHRYDSAAAHTTSCREKECIVYAEINKQKQMLYLWITGELKDSFPVSTGKGKQYETPDMNRHPAGPVLTKYDSKKFPGGNYMGLGNMPYAVFISGGYAIHGTTPGNYAKLGTPASHGCIRLHPDNAKLFNALVKTVGLGQVWVRVKG